MSAAPPLLIIAGPTGTGKSRLTLDLAQRWNAEIISADSRQIYRYMDIGTSKPTPQERNLVPHHMIDIVEPDQCYSAGEFGKHAREIIDLLMKKKGLPMLVGGTGLYIRAVIDGLAPSPPSDPCIKRDLLKQTETRGIRALYNELSEVDPLTASRLHPNDRQRILRALEVFYMTGKRLSDFHKNGSLPPRYPTIFLFINRPRPVLFDMINQRVEAMFQKGLIEEVKDLINKGYTPDHPGMQSLGYSDMWDYLQGNCSLQKVKHLMKRDTRRYAKRQITWFRKEKRATWLDVPENGDVLDLIPYIESIMKRERHTSQAR